MLISTVTAVTAEKMFAQSSDLGTGKDRGYARLFGERILTGQGFALNGDQYHILDVNAIKTSNNAQMAAKAQLRFAGQAYALNITGYDNQSLTGDVMTLPPAGTNQTGFTPATVGHISLSISKYEGKVLSTGTLTMNGTNYKVLLTSSAIAPGNGPHNFNGTFRSHNFNGTFRSHNSKR